MKTLFKTLTVAAALTLTYPAVAAGPASASRPFQQEVSKEQYIKFAEERFATMDANKDGKITAQERAAKRPGRGMGPGASLPAEISKKDYLKFAEERFAALDTNKDGKVTAQERAAKRPGRGMGPGASMPAEMTKEQHLKFAEERFNALDTNKDGKITAEERMAQRGSKHGMMRHGHGPRAGFGPAASLPASK